MNLVEKSSKKKRLAKKMVKANELYEKAMKEFMTSAKEAKSDQDSEWEFKIEREGG